MFHTYNFGSASFVQWLSATDQLHYTQYLELGGCKNDYVTLRKSDVNADSHDQFLLYIDDEAGVCGSASIIALPYDLDIEGQLIPQGTWMLRNVFFHIAKSHPIQNQSDKFIRIAEQFHLGLFENLWQLAQRSDHKMALSLQHDLEAHEDLEFFGGFTFDSEMMEEDQGLQMTMGVMPLTAQTYDAYRQKVRFSERTDKDVYIAAVLSKAQSQKSKGVS